jgi:hypothetical protein
VLCKHSLSGRQKVLVRRGQVNHPFVFTALVLGSNLLRALALAAGLQSTV